MTEVSEAEFNQSLIGMDPAIAKMAFEERRVYNAHRRKMDEMQLEAKLDHERKDHEFELERKRTEAKAMSLDVPVEAKREHRNEAEPVNASNSEEAEVGGEEDREVPPAVPEFPMFGPDDEESVRGVSRKGLIRLPFERANLHQTYDFRLVQAIQKWFRHDTMKHVMMYLNCFWAQVTISGHVLIFEKQTRMVSRATERGETAPLVPVTEYAAFSCAEFVKAHPEKLSYTKTVMGQQRTPYEVPAEINIVEYWRSSDMRLLYKYQDSVPCPPGKQRDPTCFNLYAAPEFDVATPLNWEDLKAVEPTLDFIWKRVARQIPSWYRYVVGWVASATVQPWEKIGSALVLQGEMGSGKTTFAHKLGELIGTGFGEFSSDMHVTGQFNKSMLGKTLVCLNEAIWKGDHKSAGVMKSLITEEDILINPKGKEAFWAQCKTNFLYTSSEDEPVPIELGDRRFAVFRLTDEHAGIETDESKVYFERQRKVPGKNLFRVLHAVTQQDWYKKLSFRKVPVTDAIMQIKMLQLNSFMAYMQYWLETGALEVAIQHKDSAALPSELQFEEGLGSTSADPTLEGQLEFPLEDITVYTPEHQMGMPYKQAVWAAYTAWYTENKIPSWKALLNKSHFWVQWRILFRPFIDTFVGIGDDRGFFKPGTKNRRFKVYMPDLTTARDCFRARLSGSTHRDDQEHKDYRFPDELKEEMGKVVTARPVLVRVAPPPLPLSPPPALPRRS